jgi:tubby-related protein 1
LGKLRSNFIGTEFLLFDTGENPKKGDPMSARKELCYIEYEKNILGLKGPRKLRVTNQDTLKNARDFAKTKVKYFINNPPQWSDEYQAFVLDFYGWVEFPSVKNFQLIEASNSKGMFSLQFGKVDQNLYNLDYMTPFSLIQAVSIAISSCDNKLFCE